MALAALAADHLGGDLSPGRSQQQQALTGMSAVAAGLLLASGVKMATVLPWHWRLWLFGGFTFVGVGVLRWPLLGVVGVLAPLATTVAWKAKD